MALRFAQDVERREYPPPPAGSNHHWQLVAPGILVTTVNKTLKVAGLQDETTHGGIILTKYGLGGIIIVFV